MKEAVIIGNGEFPKKEYPRELIRRADLIVCCDGAVGTFVRNRSGIFTELREPDVVIGDLDSISGSFKARYSSILVHNSEQETNDQSKAFHFILERHPEIVAIHILAATGKREDHTIGNISLLMEYARESGACGNPSGNAPYVDMVSDHSTVFALTDSCELHLGTGRAVSIFSPDNSLTIKSTGLEWPTDNVVFDNWWKATLNKASSDVVTLSFSHKSIALVVLD